MKYEERQDAINEHLESAVERAPTTVEVIKKLTEGGKAEKYTVTLVRQFEPPQRAETPARDHTFFSLNGLAEYLADSGTSNLLVLAEADSGEMTAVLDEDEPSGLEAIRFKPTLHPLYSPWAKAYNKPMPIKEFARFVMANRRTVVEPDVESLLHSLTQITVSRKVTINDGVGPHTLNGVMVETKIQGNTSEEPVDLPNNLVIEVPMFLEGRTLSIDVDLMLETDEDGGVFATLLSSDAEHKRVLAIEAMLKDLREKLTDKLSEPVISLGKVHYADWKYVR
jgi:hypothetical protein